MSLFGAHMKRMIDVWEQDHICWDEEMIEHWLTHNSSAPLFAVMPYCVMYYGMIDVLLFIDAYRRRSA